MADARCQDRLAAVEVGPENRFGVVQAAPHARILRALSGEEKGDAVALPCTSCGDLVCRRSMPACDTRERCGNLRGIRTRNGQTFGQARAA